MTKRRVREQYQGVGQRLRNDASRAKMGIVEVWNGTRDILRGTGSVIRHTFDPVKPYIDKVVDSTAYVAGVNAAVSLGLWSADWSLEHIDRYRKIEHWLDNNNWAEFLVKTAVYGAAYTAANWKIVVPGVKERIQRMTAPSPMNYFKTGAIMATGLLSYAQGIAEPAATKMRTVDNLLSGKKTAQVIDNTKENLETIVRTGHLIFTNPSRIIAATLEDTGVEVPAETSRTIERAVEQAEESNEPGFAYNDMVSRDAARIRARGIPITSEELVYMARLDYFEGGFDRRAGRNIEAIRQGTDAIASVIFNRWKYDNQSEELYGRREFAGSTGGDVFDVAFRHTRKRGRRTGRPYTVWQFTCVRDKPEYFHPHSGRRGWDLYEGNRLNVRVGQMDPVRAQAAYESVVGVLTGEISDPTGGALFYQNPEAADSNNTPRKWRQRGLREITRINSHTFWTYRDNRADWTRNMNLGE